MPIIYNTCNYLFPHNEANTKHANIWSDFMNSQIQYIGM